MGHAHRVAEHHVWYHPVLRGFTPAGRSQRGRPGLRAGPRLPAPARRLPVHLELGEALALRAR